MVQSGPHLVDHFTRKDTKLTRGRFGDLQLSCFVTVRAGEYIRSIGGIIGNASLDSLEVLRSPGEFGFR